MSALPPKADIGTQPRNVRFVPKADNIDDVVIIDGFPLPLAGGGWGRGDYKGTYCTLSRCASRGSASSRIICLKCGVCWCASNAASSLNTCKEPGVELVTANRSVTDPAKFLFYEVFSDEAAFEAHQQTPHFKRMILEEALPRLAQRERVQYVPL